MRILVADDDPVTRNLICRKLQTWGHEALTAENGVEAFEILMRENISFLLSDWMMPKMNGIELCQQVRESDLSHYVYTILLTAKSGKDEVIRGLKAGADDFIAKPFNSEELNVRINAGIRILNLEQSLEERNRKLEDAYRTIRKDLKAAAKMQKDLLPNASSKIDGVHFQWLFLPCTFVAGDIFNFFQLDRSHIGFYILDVAGHGIPSAMLSFSLSKYFTPSSMLQQDNGHCGDGSFTSKMFSPAKAIHELNNRFQGDTETMQYFTMIYGVIDSERRKIRLSQAGHPSPILVPASGHATMLGEGGFPIGMFPDLEFEENEYDFCPGDRLYVFSDGVTECTNKEKTQYSEERLLKNLEKTRHMSLAAQLGEIKRSLYAWRANTAFSDDVSMMAIESVAAR